MPSMFFSRPSTPFQWIGALLLIGCVVLSILCVIDFGKVYFFDPHACEPNIRGIISESPQAAMFGVPCSLAQAFALTWSDFTDNNVSYVVAALLALGLIFYNSIPLRFYRYLLSTSTNIATTDTSFDSVAQTQDHAIEYETPTWIAIIRTILFLIFLLLAIAGASESLRLIGFHDTFTALVPFALIYGKLLNDVFNVGFAAAIGFGARFVRTAKKFAICTITGSFLPLVFGLITHPIRTFDHLYFGAYQVAVLAVGFLLFVLMFSLFISGLAQLLYLIHGALFLCADKVKKGAQLP